MDKINEYKISHLTLLDTSRLGAFTTVVYARTMEEAKLQCMQEYPHHCIVNASLLKEDVCKFDVPNWFRATFSSVFKIAKLPTGEGWSLERIYNERRWSEVEGLTFATKEDAEKHIASFLNDKEYEYMVVEKIEVPKKRSDFQLNLQLQTQYLLKKLKLTFGKLLQNTRLMDGPKPLLKSRMNEDVK